MAYFIEVGLARCEPLYLEIAMLDKDTGAPLPTMQNIYELRLERGPHGHVSGCAASGSVTSPEDGLIVVAVDQERLRWHCRGDTLRFELVALPQNRTSSAVIATGTISFEDRS